MNEQIIPWVCTIILSFWAGHTFWPKVKIEKELFTVAPTFNRGPFETHALAFAYDARSGQCVMGFEGVAVDDYYSVQIQTSNNRKEWQTNGFKVSAKFYRVVLER